MSARFGFPPSARVRRKREFEAVYAARTAVRAGPLVVHGRPNGTDATRLGLSVPRRVGNAVVRNRVKRLLRESFRLDRRDYPAGYDLVVNVGRHELLALDDYRRLLRRAATGIDERWRERPRSDAKTESESSDA